MLIQLPFATPRNTLMLPAPQPLQRLNQLTANPVLLSLLHRVLPTTTYSLLIVLLSEYQLY